MADRPSIESLLADLLSLFSVAGWTDHDLLDAISELSTLRAENERLRLIESGARDSEALVAHLRAENEAMRAGRASLEPDVQLLASLLASAHDRITILNLEAMSLRAENEALRKERDAALEGEHLLFSQRLVPQLVAERDAERARADEAEANYKSADADYRIFKERWNAERARADAMAASSAVIYGKLQLARELIQELRGYTEDWNWKYGAGWDAVKAATYHDPAQTSADLEAHDARVRREALEGAWERIVALGMGAEVIWVSAGMYVRAALLGPEAQDNEQEGK